MTINFCLFLGFVVVVIRAEYMDIFALKFYPNLRFSLGPFFLPKVIKFGRVVPGGN
jgi:hypothetical protein